MKTVLHISPQSPSRIHAGGMGVYQTALSLVRNGCQIDYVGPELEDEHYKTLYRNLYELTSSRNMMQRIVDLMRGITNSRYRAWCGLELDFTSYDLIVMEFTKMSYVMDKINPNHMVVRVHNVEKYFALRDYKTRKTLKTFLMKNFVERDERKIVQSGARLVFLTENDRKTMEQTYQIRCASRIIPLCLEDREGGKIKKDGKFQMLIAASLWFGENVRGIEWFIDQVTPLLSGEWHLTIAGSNPVKSLRMRVKRHKNIELIESPPDMAPYFRQADVVIAPIFDGSGMKMKVVEALSYGLPVVGTTHAFIGYDITQGVNSFQVDSAQEFQETLERIAAMGIEEKQLLSYNAKKLFVERYEMQTSVLKWGKVIEE